ncbi:3-isopropylmalate dehydratase small subunit [Pseudorhodoplanes sp.]|jgi:3-isopropylmalate/(R)-2-methylmalate dehydratase small subunit|uniref:3-isopropylmalate dehydratase small subunit n=1 Tax=Pseudorhodoplanes sp. TaxID=1934341 RepID=UPI002D00ED4E|nr:3-isopropylmalate dehydratase small subunit [Pseudorhodoplanes sp.]HWV43475.1 3-isopropylmalate dehydratase small subunit [Pseudorhodoplanes sp.]
MSGRAFVFGDNIDTDVLAPGRYMKGSIEELARHCLEAVDPDFAKSVQPGDVVVAGRNFGMGSSREQAAQALKVLGVAAVVAKSFGGIFYRNALNLGLPVVVCEEADTIGVGDRLSVDLAGGKVVNETSGRTLKSEPLPQFLLDMLADGGLVPHLEKRFSRQKAG